MINKFVQIVTLKETFLTINKEWKYAKDLINQIEIKFLEQLKTFKLKMKDLKKEIKHKH